MQASCTVTETHDRKATPITHMCPADAVSRSAAARARRPPDGKPAKPMQEEKEVFPCWEPAYQPAVCKEAAVGILVLYGDTVERGEDYKIDATCKPAPPVVAPKDPYAEADQTAPLRLGKAALTPHFHELTAHEQRELEEEHEIAGPPPEHTNMFLTIYFAMTGLHGIHVLVGIGVFLWLLFRSIRGDFTPDYYGPIDFAALYWHIVDLIWIFLFPLLYLIH